MTLPAERTRAVLATRDFLQSLAVSYGGVKNVPADVRGHARRLLKHYPLWFDLGRQDVFDPDAAQRIANAESDGQWWLGITPQKMTKTVTKRQVRARKVPK